MKRSEGPLQCHDLGQEASGASLECRVRLNGQVRLRWVRSLSAQQRAELSEGLTYRMQEAQLCGSQSFAPRPFSAPEEPGMSLGMAAFPEALPPYWLLVTAQLGPKCGT